MRLKMTPRAALAMKIFHFLVPKTSHGLFGQTGQTGESSSILPCEALVRTSRIGNVGLTNNSDNPN